VREPLEQGASLLRLPEQPRLLDGERGLVGQRREQRDLVRLEVAGPLGEDVERATTRLWERSGTPMNPRKPRSSAPRLWAGS